jgi:hypothetical protein
VQWAQASAKKLWPGRFGSVAATADPRYAGAEGLRMLFSGDAVTRALAAEALGSLRETPPAGGLMPSAAWARPYLIEAWNDNYPLVRYYVANGLENSAKKESPPKPDYLADDANRAVMILPWRKWLQRDRPVESAAAAAQAEKLRRDRRDVDVEVGE